MEYRNKRRFILKLDFIILVLSIIGLFFFTTLFVVVNSNIRFLFLGFELYSLFTLYNSSFSISNYYKEQSIKKYSKSKVNLKLLNKGRRKKTI